MSSDERSHITPAMLIQLIARSMWGDDLVSRATWKYKRPRREGDLFEARLVRGSIVVTLHVNPLVDPPEKVKPVINEACRATYELSHTSTHARAIGGHA